MGWRKFRDTLAAGALGGPPVYFTEAEAQNAVNTYRAANDRIVHFWREADAAIIDMYLGNTRQLGVLTIHKNCLVMPNGMALQYPGLRPVEPSEDGTTFGGWEYWNGKFWTNIYGGKLCLAEGTQVLTRQGWQAIEQITAGTQVWDGESWVRCDGTVYNGDKPVLELAGVAMTPDHEVLTDEGWKTASQSQGHNRAESRLPDGPGVRWERWEEIPMASAMCVWSDTSQQPAQLRAYPRQDDQAAFARDGDRGDNPVVSDRAWLALGQATDPARRNQPVYDLINCGPNNRFVVRDRYGKPLIVHNCENIIQALSRIVLFDQMLEINTEFEKAGGQVVLNVHDEVIAVGPSFGAKWMGKDAKGKDMWVDSMGADALFARMLQLMRTPRPWCPDIPLDSEGGWDLSYSK